MGAKVQQKFTEPAAKTSARRPQWGELDKLGQSEEKLSGEEVISLIPPTASLNLIRPGSLRRSLPPSVSVFSHHTNKAETKCCGF